MYEDEPERIKEFLSSYGGKYPTVVDHEGKTAISYGVYGVPETFFLSASGEIVAKYEGPLTPALLASYIAQIENKS